MSALSRAIERAQARLDQMPEADRVKHHVTILRDELHREAQGIEARSDETLQAAQPEGQEPGGDSHAPEPATPGDAHA